MPNYVAAGAVFDAIQNSSSIEGSSEDRRQLFNSMLLYKGDTIEFMYSLIQMDVEIPLVIELTKSLYDKGVNATLSSDLFKDEVLNHYCSRAIEELIRGDFDG